MLSFCVDFSIMLNLKWLNLNNRHASLSLTIWNNGPPVVEVVLY